MHCIGLFKKPDISNVRQFRTDMNSKKRGKGGGGEEERGIVNGANKKNKCWKLCDDEGRQACT
jgi:hypothetical protein